MRPVRFVNERLNHLNPEEIKQLQEVRLANQIKYAYRNSEYYRSKFDELQIKPQDIKTIEDFRKLPILMDKEQERQNQLDSQEKYGHPFGTHLCASPDDIVITATTSGTSGVPTFTYTLAQNDVDNISDAFVYLMEYGQVSPGDRVLFNYALGVYATSAILPGLRKAGVLPIDVDVRAGSAQILQFADLTKPTAAMMTPSLAEHFITKTPEILGKPVSDLQLTSLFTVGEIAIGIPEVKEKLEKAFGCRVYDYIAPLADTLAFSCDSDEYHGMHCVTPDLNLYPYDLVDPETKEALEITNGVIGEAVYSSLDRKANPMLRMASGDIVQVFTEKCPGCGFKGLRVKVIGRSDDMLIVKGVNVYPAAIKQVINQFIPEVTGETRIVLDQEPPRVTPPLKVKIEYSRNTEPADLESLGERIKNALKKEVRVNPEIIWVEPGSLEKSMAKTPVFEKNYH